MPVSPISAAKSTEGLVSPFASRLDSFLEDLREDLLALALPGVSGKGTGAGGNKSVPRNAGLDGGSDSRASQYRAASPIYPGNHDGDIRVAAHQECRDHATGNERIAS